MTHLPLVEVQWFDSQGGGNWVALSEAEEMRACYIHTVGWCVHQDEHVVTVTSSLCTSTDQVYDPIVIPRAAIETFQVLSLLDARPVRGNDAMRQHIAMNDNIGVEAPEDFDTM